jgi:hypothetical protein
LEFGESDGADLDTAKVGNLTAQRFKETSDFPVASLGKFQFDNTVGIVGGQKSHSIGFQHLTVVENTLGEGGQLPGIDAADDIGDVDFANAVTGMGQAQAELAVVGQEKEAFTVSIQSTYGMQGLHLRRQQFANRGPLFGIFARAKEAAGLVDGQIDVALRSRDLAIHSDLILVRLDFGAQFPDDTAVYCDFSLQNQALGSAAGCHAGVGEGLLKSNHREG